MDDAQPPDYLPHEKIHYLVASIHAEDIPSTIAWLRTFTRQEDCLDDADQESSLSPLQTSVSSVSPFRTIISYLLLSRGASAALAIASASRAGNVDAVDLLERWEKGQRESPQLEFVKELWEMGENEVVSWAEEFERSLAEDMEETVEEQVEENDVKEVEEEAVKQEATEAKVEEELVTDVGMDVEESAANAPETTGRPPSSSPGLIITQLPPTTTVELAQPSRTLSPRPRARTPITSAGDWSTTPPLRSSPTPTKRPREEEPAPPRPKRAHVNSDPNIFSLSYKPKFVPDKFLPLKKAIVELQLAQSCTNGRPRWTNIGSIIRKDHPSGVFTKFKAYAREAEASGVVFLGGLNEKLGREFDALKSALLERLSFGQTHPLRASVEQLILRSTSRGSAPSSMRGYLEEAERLGVVELGYGVVDGKGINGKEWIRLMPEYTPAGAKTAPDEYGRRMYGPAATVEGDDGSRRESLACACRLRWVHLAAVAAAARPRLATMGDAQPPNYLPHEKIHYLVASIQAEDVPSTIAWLRTFTEKDCLDHADRDTSLSPLQTSVSSISPFQTITSYLLLSRGAPAAPAIASASRAGNSDAVDLLVRWKRSETESPQLEFVMELWEMGEAEVASWAEEFERSLAEDVEEMTEEQVEENDLKELEKVLNEEVLVGKAHMEKPVVNGNTAVEKSATSAPETTGRPPSKSPKLATGNPPPTPAAKMVELSPVLSPRPRARTPIISAADWATTPPLSPSPPPPKRVREEGPVVDGNQSIILPPEPKRAHVNTSSPSSLQPKPNWIPPKFLPLRSAIAEAQLSPTCLYGQPSWAGVANFLRRDYPKSLYDKFKAYGLEAKALGIVDMEGPGKGRNDGWITMKPGYGLEYDQLPSVAEIKALMLLAKLIHRPYDHFRKYAEEAEGLGIVELGLTQNIGGSKHHWVKLTPAYTPATSNVFQTFGSPSDASSRHPFLFSTATADPRSASLDGDAPKGMEGAMEYGHEDKISYICDAIAAEDLPGALAWLKQLNEGDSLDVPSLNTNLKPLETAVWTSSGMRALVLPLLLYRGADPKLALDAAKSAGEEDVVEVLRSWKGEGEGLELAESIWEMSVDDVEEWLSPDAEDETIAMAGAQVEAKGTSEDTMEIDGSNDTVVKEKEREGEDTEMEMDIESDVESTSATTSASRPVAIPPLRPTPAPTAHLPRPSGSSLLQRSLASLPMSPRVNAPPPIYIQHPAVQRSIDRLGDRNVQDAIARFRIEQKEKRSAPPASGANAAMRPRVDWKGLASSQPRFVSIAGTALPPATSIASPPAAATSSFTPPHPVESPPKTNSLLPRLGAIPPPPPTPRDTIPEKSHVGMTLRKEYRNLRENFGEYAREAERLGIVTMGPGDIAGKDWICLTPRYSTTESTQIGSALKLKYPGLYPSFKDYSHEAESLGIIELSVGERPGYEWIALRPEYVTDILVDGAYVDDEALAEFEQSLDELFAEVVGPWFSLS
ncbi:hypothetical protein MNV49_001188 [Pseudohyphozyma bogoriensis]|nr:hypothetical protein MNV49_001188 [Pseudohyphozyma bogoriensis]